MKCMACRSLLWLYWFILFLVTGAYAILSLVSFANVYKAYDDDKEGAKQLRAMLAATFFGCILVALFIVFSFLIFLGKTMRHSGVSFGFGLILSGSLHMFVTSLLCALVMHGFEEEVEENLEKNQEIDWAGVETDTYQSTWIMAYISSGIYLGFFVLLILARNAFRIIEHTETVKEDSKDDA